MQRRIIERILVSVLVIGLSVAMSAAGCEPASQGPTANAASAACANVPAGFIGVSPGAPYLSETPADRARETRR